MRIQRILFLLLFLGALTILGVMTYRLYSRIGMFGCGDECINYTAGYFLLRGKILYKEIFFNHQPSLAYISAVIQWLAHPQNIYQLVLAHRMFVFLYSLGFACVLVWRFGWRTLLFLSLYEGTKVYVYGYQFIGEAFVVYPLVYLFGLLWDTWRHKQLKKLDIWVSPVLTWFLCMTREPYIPLACIVFFLLICEQKKAIYVRTLIGIFIALSVLSLTFLSLKDYIVQVVFANIAATQDGSLLRGLLYPLLIFTEGKWSYFRFIEIGISIFFFLSICRWVQKTKKITPIIVILLLLGFAGLRTVTPGTMYFEAFHMLPWYGLFCMVTSTIIAAIAFDRTGKVLAFSFGLFIIWTFISPRAFIWERVDRQKEFESQYAKYTQYSEVIKILSTPHQTLFLDMWDDIIYWESGRDSSYRYSLYIPVAVRLPLYRDERIHMFRISPPNFYYSCPGIQTSDNALPQKVEDVYIQLLSNAKAGCLYIKKSIVGSISQDQWERVNRLGITLP